MEVVKLFDWVYLVDDAGNRKSNGMLVVEHGDRGIIACIVGDHRCDAWPLDEGEVRVLRHATRRELTLATSVPLYFCGEPAQYDIDARKIREIAAPPFSLDSVLDPNFTAGLDPVEYLEKPHEGDLA